MRQEDYLLIIISAQQVIIEDAFHLIDETTKNLFHSRSEEQYCDMAVENTYNFRQ